MQNQLIIDQGWFSLAEEGDSALWLTFYTSQNHLLAFEILLEQPLPSPEICRGKRVTITGKGPMWAYSHAAAWAVAGGVRELLISSPKLPSERNPLQVYPLNQGATDLPWVKHTREKDLLKIEFQQAKNSQDWQPEVLGDLPNKLQLLPEEKRVLFTGAGPIWMYAGSIAMALSQGAREILYHSFTESREEAYSVWPEPRRLLTALPRRFRPGLRIGIVGDPNSGKSVFSFLLETACQKLGMDVWRYDCDAASGTPDWYVDLSRRNPEEGTQLRGSQKRTWTSTLEQQVAQRLQSLKHGFAVIIADLPGGLHKQGHPSAEAQRIPPGREIIMKEIDAFIIIDVSERQSGLYWHEALAQQGLQGRILATLRSTSPDCPLSLELDDSNDSDEITGVLTGLDRNFDFIAGPEAILPFAEVIRKRLQYRENEIWGLASSFAAERHRTQSRNDGTHYMGHLFRVAMTVRTILGVADPAILAAAILHDVLEDTPTSYDELLEAFGTTVADLVATLSHDNRLPRLQRREEYQQRLLAAPWQARLIKCADIYDNILDTLNQGVYDPDVFSKFERAFALTAADPQLESAAEALRDLQKEIRLRANAATGGKA